MTDRTCIGRAKWFVATGGGFGLLFFYRLLAGYWFVEGEEPLYRPMRRRRRRYRSRRYGAAYYDD